MFRKPGLLPISRVFQCFKNFRRWTKLKKEKELVLLKFKIFTC